jgi:hypothetical protein
MKDVEFCNSFKNLIFIILFSCKNSNVVFKGSEKDLKNQLLLCEYAKLMCRVYTSLSE